MKTVVSRYLVRLVQVIVLVAGVIVRLALATVALVRIGNMKLFGRTSGYYLFWTGFVYFFIGLYLALTHSGLVNYATAAWLVVVSIPLWCPPVARHFNMEPMMFDWFKSREERAKDYDNVVKFPKPEAVPYVAPPAEPEKPAKIFYRIGSTDRNRVAFSMGMTEITMNREGVQNMIDQLTVFMNQLHDEEEEQ